MLICGRGNTDEEARRDHDNNLLTFLQRCHKKGIRLNRRKAVLRTKSTAFFGFVLTDQGVQIDPEKQKAIATMKDPKDVIALKSFLGMLSHISRFIPKLAEVVAPLRRLCNRDAKWHWGNEQRESFGRARSLVAQSMSLAFFDPAMATEIECDAGQYGLGAALIQNDQPVYFASRTMTPTETRYAQIERELLAVVYALKRFHYFIYPRKVTVFTDHRPLVNIMGKALVDVPLRLQKMLMEIQRYNISLIFRPGKEMKFADALSGCPMDTDSHHIEEVRVIKTLPMRDTTLARVIENAKEDQTYQDLLKFVRHGWPEHKQKVPNHVREYFPYRGRFTIENDIILKDDAVLIPKKMREEIRNALCCAHLSTVKTLERANTCVFWPRMKAEIEQHKEHCEGCQKFPNVQRKEPLIPHEIPVRPWQKVAIDIAETNAKKMLVAVCYYSNMILVSELPQKPTTRSITSRLASLFSEYGICEVLMTDADPLFRSAEFRNFTEKWEFMHKMSSPHHHQSNGKVEAAVAIIKRIIMRSQEARNDWRKGLLAYNDTPQQRLGGATPGQMFMSRRLRTGIPAPGDQLRPTTKVHKKAIEARKKAIKGMKKMYDRGTVVLPSLRPGDAVSLQPMKLGVNEWTRGTVVQKLQDRSYVVRTERGILRRNRKHMVKIPATSAEPYNEHRREPQFNIQRNEPELNQKAEGLTIPSWLWQETEQKVTENSYSEEEYESADDSESTNQEAREEGQGLDEGKEKSTQVTTQIIKENTDREEGVNRQSKDEPARIEEAAEEVAKEEKIGRRVTTPATRQLRDRSLIRRAERYGE